MLTQASTLAAYLYIRMSDHMPADVLNDDGTVNVAATNEEFERWLAAPDPSVDLLQTQLPRLERFIVRVEQLLDELQALELDESEPANGQYMALVYNAANDTFDHDRSQLRTFFAWLYMVLFERADGPRWGDFIDVYGVDEFTQLVRNRMENLI